MIWLKSTLLQSLPSEKSTSLVTCSLTPNTSLLFRLVHTKPMVIREWNLLHFIVSILLGPIATLGLLPNLVFLKATARV